MYLDWGEKNVAKEATDAEKEKAYDEGFVFTRIGPGAMRKTRSLRVDLSEFALNSENRRVLKKTDGQKMECFDLPYADYHWSIAKTAKDFYAKKFGEKIFSANKIKEIFTSDTASNFNRVLRFAGPDEALGFCVGLETENIFHYSYPFYNLETSPKDMGLGMMLRAILFFKEKGKKFFYLGSAQRPNDTYKLEFAGLNWFDGKTWQKETADLKKILKPENPL